MMLILIMMLIQYANADIDNDADAVTHCQESLTSEAFSSGDDWNSRLDPVQSIPHL